VRGDDEGEGLACGHAEIFKFVASRHYFEIRFKIRIFAPRR